MFVQEGIIFISQKQLKTLLLYLHDHKFVRREKVNLIIKKKEEEHQEIDIRGKWMGKEDEKTN